MNPLFWNPILHTGSGGFRLCRRCMLSCRPEWSEAHGGGTCQGHGDLSAWKHSVRDGRVLCCRILVPGQLPTTGSRFQVRTVSQTHLCLACLFAHLLPQRTICTAAYGGQMLERRGVHSFFPTGSSLQTIHMNLSGCLFHMLCFAGVLKHSLTNIPDTHF